MHITAKKARRRLCSLSIGKDIFILDSAPRVTEKDTNLYHKRDYRDVQTVYEYDPTYNQLKRKRASKSVSFSIVAAAAAGQQSSGKRSKERKNKPTLRDLVFSLHSCTVAADTVT